MIPTDYTAKNTYRILILTALCGLASAAFAGCAPTHSYLEPSQMPKAEVEAAIIRTPTPLLRNGRDSIVIKTIDGKAPTFTEYKWVVQPGWHDVVLEIELRHEGQFIREKTYMTRVNRKVSVYAEAEREYVVDAKEDDKGLWIWVYDAETKSVVAGEAPPDISGS